MSPRSAHATNLVTAEQLSEGLREARSLYEQLQSDSQGFSELSFMLKSLAGINMPLNKKNLSLMASRLSSIIQSRGLRDYSAYSSLLRTGDHGLVTEFIQALTTNTTHFFREAQHFDLLAQLMPKLIERKKKDPNPVIRVWCAAASTGQEPYTIAMTLSESLAGRAGWDIKFLATDIDLDVLSKAAKGLYSETDAASLPPAQRQKFFRPAQNEKGQACWQANAGLQSMIRFAQLNLIQEKYPFQHPFDIVFCRNVLIYFDADTASKVVDKLASTLNPGGYLFLGHSETGTMRSQLLKSIAHAAYERKGGT